MIERDQRRTAVTAIEELKALIDGNVSTEPEQVHNQCKILSYRNDIDQASLAK
jgi:hypothetical protein